MEPFLYRPGTTPLLLSVPHCATSLLPGMAGRMNPLARRLPDTDWHVARLYAFAEAMGASLLVARYSRYAIDLNRPPDGAPLYPGADNTELCPVRCFDQTPVYLRGEEPPPAEVEARRARIWGPYHARLRSALEELRARHGVALLFDAHSIRSRVPRFFEGELPDFNLGTANGASCDPALRGQLTDILARAPRANHVVDGRFKGGYITRHYGRPAQAIHAVQLELAQRTYMDEDFPFAYGESLAKTLQETLRALLARMLAWAAPFSGPGRRA